MNMIVTSIIPLIKPIVSAGKDTYSQMMENLAKVTCKENLFLFKYKVKLVFAVYIRHTRVHIMGHCDFLH